MSTITQAPTRPLVRYHGGKWKLAPWIISHFPSHRVYVETHGGGGSVLLRKAPCYAEVYNDLDGEVVNLFRVARDNGSELLAAVELTPYSRNEFEESYDSADSPVEQARRTLLRSAAGFSTTSANGNQWRTGIRSNVTRSGTTPAGDWRRFPDALHKVIDRLRGVVIENLDACEVMKKYDSPETLFYCDPPYVLESRSSRWAGHAYRHEMTDKDHSKFAEQLAGLRGAVIVSGYHSALYDELFKGWRRVEREAHADGARKRTEVLWMNFQPQNQLFT